MYQISQMAKNFYIKKTSRTFKQHHHRPQDHAKLPRPAEERQYIAVAIDCTEFDKVVSHSLRRGLGAGWWVCVCVGVCGSVGGMFDFYLKELVCAASQGLESLLCNLSKKLLRINLWFLINHHTLWQVFVIRTWP